LFQCHKTYGTKAYYKNCNTLLRVILIPLWKTDRLEKLTVATLVKKSPDFYGTRKFITVLTRTCHWSLSCPQIHTLFL